MYHFIFRDLKFHTLIIMRYTERQCEFKACTEIAWCHVAVCPTTGEAVVSKRREVVLFKHCGSHPLWSDSVRGTVTLGADIRFMVKNT